MVQQPGFGGAMADSHRQRLLREVTGELRLQRPADHGVGVESKDDRTREPALRGPDRGDVSGPHHTRFGLVIENWRSSTFAATGIR